MLADPRHQQPLAIGTPPAAVVAAHLLGRAELGRAEAHLRVRVRQLQQHPAVQAGDPQRPAGQPGDRVPVRAELRVDARARDRNLARDPAVEVTAEVAGEQPPGQREHGPPAAAVQRVRHDAARGLPHPLAAPLLGRRDHLGLAVQQRARVGQQPFLPGRGVERPQAGDRVVGRERAQEQQPAGGERQVPRPAEQEPAAAREPPQPLVGISGHCEPITACRHLGSVSRGPFPMHSHCDLRVELLQCGCMGNDTEEIRRAQQRRGRDRLPDLRRRRRRAAAAHRRPRLPDGDHVARRVLPGPGRPRLPRGPVRQPRHRPVHPRQAARVRRRQAAARAVPPHRARLHRRRHGRRRRRRHGRARLGLRPRHGRLHGCRAGPGHRHPVPARVRTVTS